MPPLPIVPDNRQDSVDNVDKSVDNPIYLMHSFSRFHILWFLSPLFRRILWINAMLPCKAHPNALSSRFSEKNATLHKALVPYEKYNCTIPLISL